MSENKRAKRGGKSAESGNVVEKKIFTTIKEACEKPHEIR